MSKSDTDNFILSEWMVWFFVVLTLAVAWLVYDARTAQAQIAQSDTHYMLLYRGSNGLHFDCVDEYPYDDIRRMECELNVCAAHVNRGAFWIEAK
jgi:hypothetical protein